MSADEVTSTDASEDEGESPSEFESSSNESVRNAPVDGLSDNDLASLEYDLIPEEPLLAAYQDKFGHRDYVDVLERLVVDQVGDAPQEQEQQHVGIFGTWGTGKTSIINMLRTQLNRTTAVGEPEIVEGSVVLKRNHSEGGNITLANVNCADGRLFIDKEHVLTLDGDERAYVQGRSDTDSGDSISVDRIESYPDDEDPDLAEHNETSEVEMVYFNAWRHAEDSLRTDLLLTITDKLEERYGTPDETEPSKFANWFEKDGDNADGDDFRLHSKEDVLRELYDVVETEDVDESTFLGTVRDGVSFVSSNPFSIIFVVAFTCAIIGWYLGLVSAPQGTILSFSAGLLGALYYIVERADQSANEVQRHQVAPRRRWSGSYEELFTDQIDAVVQNEENEVDRVIIAIDDLDRCETSTVYEVLVSLKTFLGKERCTYLIPCDKEALQDHVRSFTDGEYFEDPQGRRNFLQKFFDVEMTIPSFRQEEISQYAVERGQELTDSPSEDALDILSYSEQPTPRHAVRLINRLQTLRNVFTELDGEELEASEDVTKQEEFLAKVLVINQEFPNAYRFFEQHPGKFETVLDYFKSSTHTDSTLEAEVAETFRTIGYELGTGTTLNQFLTNTKTVNVDDVRPYLQLGQPTGEYSARKAFETDLQQNNLPAAKTAIAEAYVTQRRGRIEDYADATKQYVENAENSSTTETTTALRTAGELLGSFEPQSDDSLTFSSPINRRITKAATDVIREEPEVLDQMSIAELRPFIEREPEDSDDQKEKDEIISLYEDRILIDDESGTRKEVNYDNLTDLLESFSSDTSRQEAFATRLREANLGREELAGVGEILAEFRPQDIHSEFTTILFDWFAKEKEVFLQKVESENPPNFTGSQLESAIEIYLQYEYKETSARSDFVTELVELADETGADEGAWTDSLYLVFQVTGEIDEETASNLISRALNLLGRGWGLIPDPDRDEVSYRSRHRALKLLVFIYQDANEKDQQKIREWVRDYWPGSENTQESVIMFSELMRYSRRGNSDGRYTALLTSLRDRNEVSLTPEEGLIQAILETEGVDASRTFADWFEIAEPDNEILVKNAITSTQDFQQLARVLNSIHSRSEPRHRSVAAGFLAALGEDIPGSGDAWKSFIRSEQNIPLIQEFIGQVIETRVQWPNDQPLPDKVLVATAHGVEVGADRLSSSNIEELIDELTSDELDQLMEIIQDQGLERSYHQLDINTLDDIKGVSFDS